jgi:hypothetical protein
LISSQEFLEERVGASLMFLGPFMNATFLFLVAMIPCNRVDGTPGHLIPVSRIVALVRYRTSIHIEPTGSAMLNAILMHSCCFHSCFARWLNAKMVGQCRAILESKWPRDLLCSRFICTLTIITASVNTLALSTVERPSFME